jgi:outer membrane protein OmpA-like peptidoglycan-associated protein
MKTIIFHSVLIFIVSSMCVSTSFADNCTVALERVEMTIATPPSMNTEEQFQSALKQCPDKPRLYLLIGDYYDHWRKYDISPEKQAYYNYLATEYYAKGIKSGKGDEIKSMKFKLAALESGAEEITEVGIRSVKPYVRLNIRVFFEFNSKELTSGGQEQLDVLGKYMVEANSSRIILEGHTDMAGSEDYNIALSFQRAESAKQYLVENYNIDPDIIETQGYGFGRLADVVDPYNAKNRRVRVRKLPK